MHNIETIFYFGQTPWHGLGVPLKEIPTSEKAIIAAGLDWKVTKEKLYYAKENIGTLDDQEIVGSIERVEDYFAIKRSDKQDSKSILGIVGKRYSPVQNINAFNFFDTVVGEKKAIYHTAGSLDKGKVVWILAKLPEGISISSNDNIELYTLLMNRHDGKRSVIVQPTPIRVVCQNTLNMALVENKNRLTFRHTKNVDSQMKMAALSLNHSLKTFEETKEAYKLIAKKEVTSDSLKEYFDNVVDFNEKSRRSINRRSHLIDIFDYDTQKNNLRPSLWIAYNAITYWVDHEKGKSDDKRLSNAWTGNGFSIKQKALDVAIQMAAA
jgi:phage/plasmid-like protein (TIGR03299 family)